MPAKGKTKDGKGKDGGLLSPKRIVVAAGVLLGVLVLWRLVLGGGSAEDPNRLGAGILLVSGTELLLLQRISDSKWAVPGGNFNSTMDLDLFATAMREATEVMGYLPQHEIHDQILTQHGPEDSKEFTVFIATVPPAAKAAYLPRVGAEPERYPYTKSEWFELSKLDGMMDQLHPVMLRVWEAQNKAKVMVLAQS